MQKLGCLALFGGVVYFCYMTGDILFGIIGFTVLSILCIGKKLRYI